MRILAFDTSTVWCSVALGDGAVWLQHEEEVGQMHSERVLPIAQALVAKAGWTMSSLDGIAFGAGPGSFTGIRIACGVAQGLALGLGVAVAPVSTLAAIAQEAHRQTHADAVLACIDARMGEVYVAAYRNMAGRWVECAAPAVLSPDEVTVEPHVPWTGAGNGFSAHPRLAQRLAVRAVLPDVRPGGRAVGEIGARMLAAGEGVAAEDALPIYVRQRVALTTAEREAGVRL